MASLIPGEKITEAVWCALDGVDSCTHMPVGKAVSLEWLCDDQDGIFKTPEHFRRIISRNFVYNGELVESVPLSFLKRYAHPESSYMHLFAQKVGADSWFPMPSSDLEITYSFQLHYGQESGKPISIELFVTANFKE